MDSERRSAVGSYYGSGAPAPYHDDYSPTNPHFASGGRGTPTGGRGTPSGYSRSSMDALNQTGRQSSAGYNQMSFPHAGRQEPLKGGRDEREHEHEDEEMGFRGGGAGEDGGWDVYADFNNTGPRYSTAFMQPNAGYQAVSPDPKTPLEHEDDGASGRGNYETVTVPALGSEWKASELHDMSRAGKRERRFESRRQAWKDWNRNERGMCGGFCTRRTLVFTMFALIAATGVTLAFTIPRVPGFSFNGDSPLQQASGDFNASIPAKFSTAPANFSFAAVADVQLDTGANFLPLTFNRMQAKVFDLDTGRQVAHGALGKTVVPAKAFPHVQLPLNFSYVANNASDQTWTNWHKACQNHLIAVNGTRPGVNFRLEIDQWIAGLIGQRTAVTSITSASCPIELPSNSP